MGGLGGVYTVSKDKMHKMQLAKLAKSKRNFTGTVVKENKGKLDYDSKLGGAGGGGATSRGR